MNNIIHIIRHTARAATVLLLVLLTTQTARAADLTITTIDGWKTFARAVAGGTDYSGMTVALGADLDFTSTTFNGDYSVGFNLESGWGQQSKPFKGTFDGCGHTIKNATITDIKMIYNFNCLGAIFWINEGTIKNTHFENITVNGQGSYTAIVAKENEGTIEDCTISGRVNRMSGNYNNTGGVVYNNAGAIRNCVVNIINPTGGMIQSTGNGAITNVYTTSDSQGWEQGTRIYKFVAVENGGVTSITPSTEAVGTFNGNKYYTAGTEVTFAVVVESGKTVDPIFCNGTAVSRGAGGAYTYTVTAEDIKVQTKESLPTRSINIASVSGGTMSANPPSATAYQEITLTASPASGYLLNGVTASDGTNPVSISYQPWYKQVNTATFTMPNADVTVTPTFTAIANTNNEFSVNIPATGTETGTIPSGVKSFKLYDNGGANGNYSNNCNGKITLTAPSGYAFVIEGTVKTWYHCGILNVSDENGSVLSNVYSTGYNGPDVTIPPTMITGRQLTFEFIGDNQTLTTREGVDLTVSLVDANQEFSVTIAGTPNGTVNPSKTSAKAGEVVTLTAAPNSGYLIKSVAVTYDTDKNISVSGGWWTGSFSFTMPYANVTVTPVVEQANADGGLNISGLTYVPQDGDNPGYYAIDGANALNALASYVNGGGRTEDMLFKQTADIDMSGVSYTTIGNDNSFNGTFDGDGYVILNLSYYASGVGNYESGLIGNLRGTVRNVNLKDCSFTGTRAGGIAGSMPSGSIINCAVIGGTVTCAYGGQAGAIAGNFYSGTIQDCFTTATVSMVGTSAYIGAIAGGSGNITNCYYTIEPANKYYSGGTKVTVYNITLADGIIMTGNIHTVGRTAANTYHFGRQGDNITFTSEAPTTGIKKFTTTAGTLAGTSTAGTVTLTMPASDVTVSLSDVTPEIADIDAQTYTGNAIEPTVTVSNMTADTDYTVSYSDNTNAGTATVTIAGKGFYFGTVIKPFTIAKATPTITAPVAVTNLIYNGSKQALVSAGTTDFGAMTYSLDGTNYSTDIPTAKNAGTYIIYYKVEASDNWNAVDAQTVEVTIAPRTYTVTFDANGGEGTMEPMLLTYDGEGTALTANTFTRSGYGFKEWNTEPDGSGTNYYDEEEVYNLTDEVNGNVVLYAQWGWDIATCDIKGTLEAYDDGYGPYYPLGNNVEVWNGDTQLTFETDYTIELDPNVGIYDYVVGEQYQATIKGTGDWGGKKTFTFTFVALHHTIVFDANGGTGTMDDDTVANDDGYAGRYYLPACGFTAPLGKVFDHWVASCEPDAEKQPGDYFTAPYIWSEYDVQTITVTAYWRDALILFDDDSAQPEGSKNADIIAANNGTTGLTVQLVGRTLYKDGSWNTLCLPFSVGDPDASLGHWFDDTPLEGASVMTLANSAGSNTGFDSNTGVLSLYFVEANQIEAGVPYIVKWPEVGSNLDNPVFESVTIENEVPADNSIISNDGTVSFAGIYSPASLFTTDHANYYLGADNKLYYPSRESFQLRAFRCYFHLNDPSLPVKGFVLGFDDDATGIDAIDHSSLTIDHSIYNLAGQRLNKAQKGINIINGKKILK